MGFDFGTAFGAYANMADKLDQQREQQENWQKQFGLQQAADARQQRESDYVQSVRDAQEAHRAQWAPILKRVMSGDYSDVPGLLDQYNGNTGAYADGNRAVFQSAPGGKQVMSIIGKGGNVVHSAEVTPQSMHDSIMQMAAMDWANTRGSDFGRYASDQQNFGLKGRELATKEEANRINDLYRSGMLDYYGNALQETTRHDKAMEGLQGANAKGFENVVNLVDSNGNAAPFSFNRQTGKFESLQLPSGYKFATQKAPVDPEINRQFRTAVDPLIMEQAQLMSSGKKDEKVQNRLRDIAATISALRTSYGMDGDTPAQRLKTAPPLKRPTFMDRPLSGDEVGLMRQAAHTAATEAYRNRNKQQ